MVSHFLPLRQPLGSNRCFPTTVLAILLWHGETVTLEDVSEWCLEDQDGCVLDLALDGLREAGIDIEELIAHEEEEARSQLQSIVGSEEEAQPVIVTLKNPFLPVTGDHAVVVLHIEMPENEESTGVVEYMDPLTGEIVRDEKGRFWQYWGYAGLRAFVIHP